MRGGGAQNRHLRVTGVGLVISNFHVIVGFLWGGGSYLSTFENFPGVESARQLVCDILPIARGRYK